MLGSTLNTIHNLYFYKKFMADARESIINHKFKEFKDDFFSKRGTSHK